MLPMRRLCSLANRSSSGAGHGAVVVHDFCQHASWIEAGQVREVDTPPRCDPSLQHPPGSLPKRIHVAGRAGLLQLWPGSIRPGYRVRSEAEIPVEVPLAGIDAHREGGAANVGAGAAHHHWEVELVELDPPLHGHSENEPARVADHESDLGRGDLVAAMIRSPSFSRRRRHHDDHVAAGNRCDEIFDRGKLMVGLQQPLDILGQDVEFEVDPIAGLTQSQCWSRTSCAGSVRFRNHSHSRGYGQADSIHGDRPLLDPYRRPSGDAVILRSRPSPSGTIPDDFAGGVDSGPGRYGHRPAASALMGAQVDPVPLRNRTQVWTAQGFSRDQVRGDHAWAAIVWSTPTAVRQQR